jgi:cardiolipin synthase
VLKSRGYTSLPVHYLGKMATFCLLYAFPLVLLGAGEGPRLRLQDRRLGVGDVGTGLYWGAGLLYVRQTVEIVTTPALTR